MFSIQENSIARSVPPVWRQDHPEGITQEIYQGNEERTTE